MENKPNGKWLSQLPLKGPVIRRIGLDVEGGERRGSGHAEEMVVKS